jgi:DNA-binding transcriptional LysR family regulator
MDRLSAIEIFVAVVNQEGFTAAARELDVSKSYVSKQVSRLEDRLGVRLLNRTTRHVSPTGEGEAFFERCAQILDDLEEAERALTQAHSEPVGTLRLTAPMSFGQAYLAPAAADFMSEYPDLRVDIHFTDRLVDIIEEGFDLAVRVGSLQDSSLIVRRVGPATGYAVAASSYLEERGEPTHPEDLTDHACLLYSYLQTGTTWVFQDGEGTEARIDVDGPMRANNGEALLAACTRGLGIYTAPDFITAEAIRSGKVQRVLEDWHLDVGGVWALYPHRRHLSTKVRLFVDFLADRFSDPPPWSLERDADA